MLFQVKVLDLKKIYDMPGSWSEEEYRNLLNQLEVEDIDDISGSDSLDILLMALQDIGPEKAGDLVLAMKLQKRITPGSRQNIVQDLQEGQRPWEEAADISLHAKIFTASLLLNKAFPKSFRRPDMMQLTLHLRGSKPEAKELLRQQPEAAFVTRVLADGMDEKSILERLFGEQLVSHSFSEAESIIWKSEFSDQSQQDGSSAILTVYSSAHWLDSMGRVSEFQSNAYNDSPNEEDDNS